MQKARKVELVFVENKLRKDVISMIEANAHELACWALSCHGHAMYPHYHLVLSLKKPSDFSDIAQSFGVSVGCVNRYRCSFDDMVKYISQNGKYPVLKG